MAVPFRTRYRLAQGLAAGLANNVVRVDPTVQVEARHMHQGPAFAVIDQDAYLGADGHFGQLAAVHAFAVAKRQARKTCRGGPLGG